MENGIAPKVMSIVEYLESRQRALMVSEVAELLAVSERQIYKLISENRIPGSFKVGNSIRLDGKTLAAWVKAKLVLACVPREEQRRRA